MHHKKRTARATNLSPNTHCYGVCSAVSRLVNSDTVPFGATANCRLHVQQRCADCGFADADPQQLLIGFADWQRTDFFIERSRCCDHNEYSVKILHAVRSAITATAELLVSWFVCCLAFIWRFECDDGRIRDDIMLLRVTIGLDFSW